LPTGGHLVGALGLVGLFEERDGVPGLAEVVEEGHRLLVLAPFHRILRAERRFVQVLVLRRAGKACQVHVLDAGRVGRAKHRPHVVDRPHVVHHGCFGSAAICSGRGRSISSQLSLRIWKTVETFDEDMQRQLWYPLQFAASRPVSPPPLVVTHVPRTVPLCPRWALLLGIAGLLAVSVRCTTVRGVSALKTVAFSITRVSSVQVGGVALTGRSSFDDLKAAEWTRLAAALSEGVLPASFDVHLRAVNPPGNRVDARLIEMDWTLLLDNKETVSGTIQDPVVLPPGDPQTVVLPVSLDLVRFFNDNLRGLVDLAAALSGPAPPQTIQLRVQPLVQTPLGRLRYPSPIRVLSEDVGGPVPQSD